MEDLKIYNPGLWLAIALIKVAIVIAWLFGIVLVLSRRDLAANERILWFLVVLFLPVLGLVLYLALAPKQAEKSSS